MSHPYDDDETKIMEEIERELDKMCEQHGKRINHYLKERIEEIKNENLASRTFSERLDKERDDTSKDVKANREKIKLHKQLPFLVAHVVEILDLKREDEEIDGNDDNDIHPVLTQSAVVKTTTREQVFLPCTGLVPASELQPSDLVGLSKDSYLILEKLPSFSDSRVKSMIVEKRPSDTYETCGGLEEQIRQLKEAIVLPISNPEIFQKVGIQPPKGVLLYGPPGTGKTMLARACASSTNSTFLRLAGSQLVQMFVGEGSRLVRNIFDLAKSKKPAIIFIDEIDAIGSKRGDDGSRSNGEREVQRTMLELLNQLDGFEQLDQVKVICATNRPTSLDPALLRSGRLDRKIELPMPNEDARESILRIHSKKMKVSSNVNFRELARSTDQFNGAQVRAVCVEAGMNALRNKKNIIEHEDYVEGISQVLTKKKTLFHYFT